MNSQFNVVLVRPEIPQNTGNIGRLCVSTGTKLHLIKPLGFTFEDKHMKRSAMDYWKHLDVTIYENWEEFLTMNNPEDLYFLTTKTDKVFWECPFKEGSFLVFGNEGSGLPEDFYEKYKNNM